MKNIKHLKVAALICLFIVSGVLSACTKENLEEYSLDSSSENRTSQEQNEKICVYVCGAVNNAGVYSLEPGARVADAINMAGGVYDTAVLTELNLAEHVCDGQKIYIPDIGEDTYESKNTPHDSRVNINTADKSELMSLPGIGEAKANQIIEYREQHGAFQNIEDIMNISGIKEAAFSKIRELIKV